MSTAALPAGPGPVIAVEGLHVRLGSRPVLHDVGFDVPPGETLIIMGPSGCGKTTLLRCLIGLQAPTLGRVRLFGHSLADCPPRTLDTLRRRVGVSFQNSALLGALTVGENVALPLVEHTSLDARTIRIMARLKLEQVGLAGHEDDLPAQLSGGMQKRAGIARALAMDPECLMLDEPSAGLDPITAAGLDQLLIRLRDALGLTLIVVTHELNSARALAHRLLMLDDGRIRLLGTLAAFESSRDPRVRQFLDRLPEDPPPRPDSVLETLTR